MFLDLECPGKPQREFASIQRRLLPSPILSQSNRCYVGEGRASNPAKPHPLPLGQLDQVSRAGNIARWPRSLRVLPGSSQPGRRCHLCSSFLCPSDLLGAPCAELSKKHTGLFATFSIKPRWPPHRTTPGKLGFPGNQAKMEKQVWSPTSQSSWSVPAGIGNRGKCVPSSQGRNAARGSLCPPGSLQTKLRRLSLWKGNQGPPPCAV
jgi:hypothetical protein